MGYRVRSEDNANYKVIEVNDGEVKTVFDKATHRDATRIAANLNRGGGFAGFTPNFFLERLTTR